VSLTLYGPGGPYAIGDTAPASAVAETFGSAAKLFIGSPPVEVAVTSLDQCAYTVLLSAELKLTDGENQHANIEDWMSFCKN
jgi:hypothetical protein